MSYSIIFFVGCFAAIMGSFFNVIIYRIPRQLSIIAPRSFCIHCQKTLSVVSLIPIIGFILCRRKCTHCGAAIPWRYVIVECLMVFITVLAWITWGATLYFALAVLISSLLLILFFIDIETHLLPDLLTYSLLGIGLIVAVFQSTLLSSCCGAVVAFGVYFLINFIARLFYKKDAIGYGDMKLAAGLGMLLGWKLGLLAVYMSFILGGGVAIFLVLLKRKKSTDYIAFGPYIIVAALLSYVFGDTLLALYFAF